MELLCRVGIINLETVYWASLRRVSQVNKSLKLLAYFYHDWSSNVCLTSFMRLRWSLNDLHNIDQIAVRIAEDGSQIVYV